MRWSNVIKNATIEEELNWRDKILAMRAREDALVGETVNFTLSLTHLGPGMGGGKVTKVKKHKITIDVIDPPRYEHGKYTLRLDYGKPIEISRLGSPAYGEDNHLSNDWGYGTLLKERYEMARTVVDCPELVAVFLHYYPILLPHLPAHGLEYNDRYVGIKVKSVHGFRELLAFKSDKKYFSVSLANDGQQDTVFGMENPSWEESVIRSLRTTKAPA